MPSGAAVGGPVGCPKVFQMAQESETSELRPQIRILLLYLLLVPEELPTQICALPCHLTKTSLRKHHRYLALMLCCPSFNGIENYFLEYNSPEVLNCFPCVHHTFLNAYFSSIGTQIPFEVLA